MPLHHASHGPPPQAELGEDKESWWPDARWPENAKERAKLLALRERMGLDQPSNQPAPEVNDPRSGGWRPGAHWAKDSDQWLERKIERRRTKREAIQAEVDELPLHQRPSIREMGRRSEAMPHPFRAMPPDVAAAPKDSGARITPYNLEGAFWQQGRTLGPLVAREVVAAKDRPPGENRDPRTQGFEAREAAVTRTGNAEFLGPASTGMTKRRNSPSSPPTASAPAFSSPPPARMPRRSASAPACR
jgi:hypothetical protein